MATVGELAYTISVNSQGFDKAVGDADRSMQGLANNVEAQGSRVKSALTKMFAGAAIATFVRDTIKAGADYQQAMNQFAAASGASADQMKRASEIAMQLGNDVQLPAASALDAGTAMEVLARGGLSAADSMAAARGTLLMAAAAGTDAASAATLTADALNTFNLEGSAASSVANILAGAANAATGEINDFGAGLQQSGSVAASFGMSVGETTTALAAMAQAGIKGSDAGTSLKTMLLALASPTKQQSDALAQLGVTAYDATGQFVGMEAISGQLADAQGRLSQEQFNAAASTAFGTDAMRAAVAMAKQGSQGFADLEAKVTAAGNAQKLAEAKAAGMSGALASLASTIETIQLDIFTSQSSEVEGVVRDLTAILPDLASGFIDIAGAAGNGAMLGLRVFLVAAQGLSPVLSLVGDLAAAAGELPDPILAAGAAMLILNRNSSTISSWGTSLKTAGTNVKEMGAAWTQAYSMARTGGEGIAKSALSASTGTTSAFSVMKAGASGLIGFLGGPLGIAITGVSLALGFLADRNERAAQAQQRNATAAQSLADALAQSNGALDENVAKTAQKALADADVIGAAKAAGIAEDDLIAAYARGGDALQTKIKALKDYAESTKFLHVQGDSTKEMMTSEGEAALEAAAALEGLADGQDSQAASADAAASAAEQLSGEYASTADAAEAAAEAIDAAREAADKAAAQQLDLSASQRAYQAAIDDAQASLQEHGATLDIDTEAGRANAAALDDQASAANAQAAAMTASGASTAAVSQYQAEARQKLAETAMQFGMTAEQANAYAASVISIPDYASTLVTMPGVLDSQTQTDLLHAKILATPDSKTIITTALTEQSMANLRALGFTVTTLPDGTVQITDNGPNAAARIDSVRNAIAGLYDKTVRITTIYQAQYVGGASGKVGGVGKGLPVVATGGLFSSGLQLMAGGGLLPNRVGGIGGVPIAMRDITRRLAAGAGIIAPGTNKLMPNGRVTGDRTDRDEIYAPIENSPRFWSLLGEGARRGGGVAMPAQKYARQLASAAAAGAATAGTTLVGGGSVNYGGFVINTPEAAPDAVLAAIKKHEWLNGGRSDV